MLYVMKNEKAERAERLRIAVELAGKENPTAAANAYGWNENTFRSHCNGNRGFSVQTGRDYALRLKVSHSWLMTGEGEPRPSKEVGIDDQLRTLPDDIKTMLADSFNQMLAAVKSRKP